MAYSMLVAFNDQPNNPIFDKFLGSAIKIDTYWESIGIKLSLPIISSLTEKADSEYGFVLEGAELHAFKEEVIQLEKFWRNTTNSEVAPSDEFFDDLVDVKSGIEKAIKHKLKLIIG
ncbi:MAG: hypothetical protein L3J75_17410 [Methylococcaceae bacterium]|nr:hypothetical protein [Methylococcaceae bacterium]